MNIRILTTLLLASGTAFAVSAGGQDGQDHARQVDTNGDGVISKEEVKAMQAKQFVELDMDGNGEITAAELSSRMLEKHKQRIERMAEMQVSRLDTNSDGAVSEEEFSARAEKGFDRRDTNGDGELSREEMRRSQAADQGRQGNPRRQNDG